MKVVIQAGGKGTRLWPYTTVLPKPLLPVGSKPVLELLLRWVRRNGTQDVYITTGYLGHLIRTFCGDGSQWDLRITYSEDKGGHTAAAALIYGGLLALVARRNLP
jgi:NDP-sugar pyrophosphorylase family protein